MQKTSSLKFAARLNAFKISAKDYWPGKNKITMGGLLRRAATAGLTATDSNYPDHFGDTSLSDLKQNLDETSMVLYGATMRHYIDARFKLGAFTHPDRTVRQLAIDETKKGLDTLAALDGNLITLWMGQDGVGYSFQANYSAMWDNTI